MDNSGFHQESDSGPCCDNTQAGKSGWPCTAGASPFTHQYMGALHPRIKKLVGVRLAKAARAHAYGKNDTVWTGPVLEGCTVAGGDGAAITLHFNQELLKDDAVMVMDPISMSVDLDDILAQWGPNNIDGLKANLGPSSPFEVEINGNATHEGTWLSLSPEGKCETGSIFDRHPVCLRNKTSFARLDGWADATIRLGRDPGTAEMLARNITGIRYAWGTNPCCPGLNRAVVGCNPNSCPLQTFNSTLPAPPFWARIEVPLLLILLLFYYDYWVILIDRLLDAAWQGGKCTWVSTTGSPPAGYNPMPPAPSAAELAKQEAFMGDVRVPRHSARDFVGGMGA
jgi:hypothetical protein